MADLAAEARAAATAPLSAGAERVLHRLAAAPLGPEPWLRSIAAFVGANSRGSATSAADHAEDAVIAMIVFDAS
jgi:hypothetical protein